MPPSLREWLPEGHLAWFVIDAVAALDVRPFYAVYRDNGQGRAAHDPAMMVAVLLYSYAIGERSSRRIERRCVEDVATRVICANQRPDHTTIAREILQDAAAVDAEEDERLGDARGDELPGELATGQGRQRWLRDAKRCLDERRAREGKPIPKSRPDRLKEARRRL
ncbi:MAG: transposase [Gemmatimonadales bacterium]